MIGGVETCRRVAAVALLALSSVVPHDGPLTVSAHVVPAADTGTQCALTVGTATTDPTLAADAARAIAAGYPTTACLPDATSLAAAEARAALPLGGTTTPGETTGGGLVAASSGGGSGTETATGSVVAQGTTTAGGTTVPTTGATSTTPATVSATVTPTDTSTSGTTTSDSTTAGTTTSETTTTSSSSGSDHDSDGSSSGGSSSGGSSSGGSSSGGSSSGGSSSGDTNDRSSDGGTNGDTGGDTTVTAPSDAGGTDTDALGWGPATRHDEFADDLSGWTVGDGTGGKRGSSAVRIAGGVATVPGGTTMSWGDGARSGRWQARLRMTVSDPTRKTAILLSPRSGTSDGGAFVLPVSGGRSGDGTVTIDPTAWHDWAVEWTPGAITAYVDGRQWYRTTDTSRLSSAPMDLALQVGRPARLDVDWVRSYPPAATPTITLATVSGTATSAATTTSGPRSTSTSTSTSGPTTTPAGS